MGNIEHKNKGKRTTGTICMLIASLLFATGGLLMKIIPWNPLAINGSRNLLGSAVIGLYLLAVRHRLRWNRTVLAGAVCVFGVTSLLATATKLTTAGSAIVLQYTAPVWIILLMYVFFRKIPTPGDMAAIAIVAAGIVCFFFDSLSSGRLLGNVIAVGSGFFFGGLYMLNQFEEGDALSSMFYGQLFTGILLSPLVAFESDFRTKTLIAVLLLGVFQVGVAYIFFFFGTLYTDPVTACVINGIEPVLNPILVAVFYGETLGPMAILGACIVLTGIFLYNLGKARRPAD